VRERKRERVCLVEVERRDVFLYAFEINVTTSLSDIAHIFL
jgi:hypothetical protein